MFFEKCRGYYFSSDGVVAEETVDSYVPPFQVETISILITEEGIKYFKWDGISEEVCTVTENTKLLPFEKIQAKLTDQIFYWYSGKGQSANDTTALEYDVVNAKLQYTYTTAYRGAETRMVGSKAWILLSGKYWWKFSTGAFLCDQCL